MCEASTHGEQAGLPSLQPDLTLVIPAYNEVSRLPGTLAAIRGGLEKYPLDYRVLVVDDGSRDGTWEVLEGFDPRFSCWRLATNAGKGAAVRAGMLRATGRVIAFTDADLPFEISVLVEASLRIAQNECDVVCGDRTVNSGRNYPNGVRWLAGVVFRQCVRHIVAAPVSDTQCPLKLYSHRAAQAVFQSTETTGFAFDVEAICRAGLLGFRIETIPVQLVNSAGSKINLRRHAWPMLLELFAIRARLRATAMAAPASERRAA